MSSTDLSSTDLDFVRDLVLREAAIVLESSKSYLVEARLGQLARRHGLAGLGELIRRMRDDAGLRAQAVDAMTTNETSWFRDVHPFHALERMVIPWLRRQRADTRRLTIWCGAASSGQEPYSLALLLRDRFPDLVQEWEVRILATDLSAAMLERCAEGRYSQLEVNRGLPAPMLVRWFTRHGADWVLDRSVRDMVEFRQLNLAADWPAMPQADLVMLRNVLIYFDAATKRRVLRQVRRVMRPDGFLFLGSAETTLGLDEAFHRLIVDRATCYRLEEGDLT